MIDNEDDWDEVDPEYVDEHEPCSHGVTPKWDCDWCKEECGE
ncbi:hypothetical protein ACKZDW_02110 (plasmid) [Ralstonia syzygii subsp. celebesensis]